MTGLFVAVAAVGGVRFVQCRERRLLWVVALFVLLAAARVESLPWRAAWLLQAGAVGVGLGMVLALAPFPPSRS